MNTRRTTRSQTYASPPVSPTPRVRTPPARDHSSSTEGDDESIASLVHSVTTPGSSSKKIGRPKGSNSKNRTNKRGLSDWEQKIIATDVEDWGGLEKIFSVSFVGVRSFCDNYAGNDEERERL
jgi:hypothetical protein